MLVFGDVSPFALRRFMISSTAPAGGGSRYRADAETDVMRRLYDIYKLAQKVAARTDLPTSIPMPIFNATFVAVSTLDGQWHLRRTASTIESCRRARQYDEISTLAFGDSLTVHGDENDSATAWCPGRKTLAPFTTTKGSLGRSGCGSFIDRNRPSPGCARQSTLPNRRCFERLTPNWSPNNGRSN